MWGRHSSQDPLKNHAQRLSCCCIWSSSAAVSLWNKRYMQKKDTPPPNRGLNPLHKSRLQSKQTLLEWGEQNRQHVIPVCWLVGFEATGFGWRGLPRLAGQLVHTRPGFTDPHHMMWTLGVNNGLRCILRGTKLVLNS